MNLPCNNLFTPEMQKVSIVTNIRIQRINISYFMDILEIVVDKNVYLVLQERFDTVLFTWKSKSLLNWSKIDEIVIGFE